jgi:hypothetical protein
VLLSSPTTRQQCQPNHSTPALAYARVQPWLSVVKRTAMHTAQECSLHTRLSYHAVHLLTKPKAAQVQGGSANHTAWYVHEVVHVPRDGCEGGGLRPQPKRQQVVHLPTASGGNPAQSPLVCDRVVGCAGAHKTKSAREQSLARAHRMPWMTLHAGGQPFLTNTKIISSTMEHTIMMSTAAPHPAT